MPTCTLHDLDEHFVNCLCAEAHGRSAEAVRREIGRTAFSGPKPVRFGRRSRHEWPPFAAASRRWPRCARFRALLEGSRTWRLAELPGPAQGS